MKVKLLVSRAGVRFSQSPGDEVDVSDAEAQRMIAAGQAVPVSDKPKRTATKAPAESRTTKRSKKADALETNDQADGHGDQT